MSELQGIVTWLMYAKQRKFNDRRYLIDFAPILSTYPHRNAILDFGFWISISLKMESSK